jgi:hypothetical protein
MPLTERKCAWALACSPFDPATFQIHRAAAAYGYCVERISSGDAAERDPPGACKTIEERTTERRG